MDAIESLRTFWNKIDKVLVDDGIAACIFDADVARDKPSEMKKLQEMRKNIPDFSKHESFLSKEKRVSEMVSDGKLDDALNRAKNFGMSGESYSNVYKTFEKCNYSCHGVVTMAWRIF